MPFDPFSWFRRSSSLPPSVEPPMQPVAGRQHQCPQPRGQWAALAWLDDGSVDLIHEARDEAQQEVNASLARAGSTSSRLRQWWTGAQPPGPPVPEIRQTYDRDIHGLRLFLVHSPSNEGAFTSSMSSQRAAERERAGWRLGRVVPDSQDTPGFQGSGAPSSNVAESGSPRLLRSVPYPDSLTFPVHHVFPAPDTVRWPLISGSEPSSPEPEENLDEEADDHQYDYTLWSEARRRVHLVTGGDHETLRSCTATIVNTTPTSGRSSGSETLVATPTTLSLALAAASIDERSAQEEDREVEETVTVRSVRVTRVGPPVLVDMRQLNRNQVEETDLGSMSPDDLVDEPPSYSSSRAGSR